ncbi:hypothetical protein L6452_23982 [Arctium lappa]|uniref:Uncharacterized protein n=1 Tax=Arctium lappa TaxID=4217 RepID=A0ACB9A942_ARCLA|nr:hypothetical protein L6452_23982 [Arctium lappa]
MFVYGRIESTSTHIIEILNNERKPQITWIVDTLSTHQYKEILIFFFKIRIFFRKPEKVVVIEGKRQKQEGFHSFSVSVFTTTHFFFFFFTRSHPKNQFFPLSCSLCLATHKIKLK